MGEASADLAFALEPPLEPPLEPRALEHAPAREVAQILLGLRAHGLGSGDGRFKRIQRGGRIVVLVRPSHEWDTSLVSWCRLAHETDASAK